MSKRKDFEEFEIVFKWMKERPYNDNSRVEDSLNRIEVLRVQDFFKSAILLIWIEADRQKDLPEIEKRYDYVQKIIDKIDEILERKNTVNWSYFFSIGFMSWWVNYVNSIWSLKKLIIPEFMMMGVLPDTLSDSFELANEDDFSIFSSIYKSSNENSGNILFRIKTLVITSLGLFEKGEVDESKVVINSAINISNKISLDETKSYVWVCLSKILVSLGETSKAIELLNSTLDLNYIGAGSMGKNHTFSEVSVIYAKIGEYKSSINTVNEMVVVWKDIDRLVTYSKIILEMIRRGDTDDAKEVFESVLILTLETREKPNS